MATTLNAPAERVNGRRLPVAALVGAALAAVANLLVLAIGNALVGPVQSAGPDGVPVGVPIPAIIIACLIPAVAAAVLLWLLGRFTRRPIRNFLIISAVFLVLSFFPPLNLPVSLSSKVVLEIMHVVAAVSIVGTLVRMGRE